MLKLATATAATLVAISMVNMRPAVAQSPAEGPTLQGKVVMLERPGRGGQGYGQSKLAQILFTMDLAEELTGRIVTSRRYTRRP